MNGCRQNPLFVWFINTCKKKDPPIIKIFHGKRGGQKNIYTPQQILELNGVVFENFTINNLHL